MAAWCRGLPHIVAGVTVNTRKQLRNCLVLLVEVRPSRSVCFSNPDPFAEGSGFIFRHAAAERPPI